MLFELLTYTALSLLICLVVAICVIQFLRKYFRDKRALFKKDKNRISVGFFHPYCNAGGGGERVLWCAVKAIQSRYPESKVVVYTGDINASPSEIVKRVKQRFDIDLPRDVSFVYLHKRRWVEADLYPYFTLLGQSFGSLFLAFEALISYLPDVYIDSTGYAFTLPLFKFIGGCSTVCYIHYPTITREMMKRVSSRVPSYNNRASVARNPVLSAAKLIYYKIFGWLYGMCGRFCDCIMVNSTWTEEHINSVWDLPLSTHRVYPPCDTAGLKAMPMAPDISESELIKIISLGQYRPEKDHPLQLKAMYELRQIVKEQVWDRVRLIFIGSCRNTEDDIRVKDMMDLCKHLSLENNVEFKVNVPYSELKEELQSSMIGLHAMWNEHFGISVVECMAAGQIMVAHKSGGPKADIIEEVESSRNGFLAWDETDYATVLATIFKLSPSIRNNIRQSARSSVDRFSSEEFDKNFLRAIGPLMCK